MLFSVNSVVKQLFYVEVLRRAPSYLAFPEC
jgi:hypothetical protein